MRNRTIVLQRLLASFVQRRDDSILRRSLPPRHEYVIPVRMTPWQELLYTTVRRSGLRLGLKRRWLLVFRPSPQGLYRSLTLLQDKKLGPCALVAHPAHVLALLSLLVSLPPF